jgi:DNA-directed RNA polymerase subunit RPC12/RpoP
MLKIVKFKGCKRCGGDLFLESDSEGVYISCLQCGAIYVRRMARTIQEPPKPKKVYAR